MVGERAELIAKLRDKHKWEWGDDALKEAADMLEADAREMRLWAGTVESRDRNIAAVRAANVLLAQQVAVPEALPAGECFKNGNVCAKCGHGEFIVADSPPPPVATGERAELIAALRLVMDCAGDIQSASDAELENALSCGDTDTEKQANAWLVARNVLAQQVAVPAPVARVDSWTSGSYSRNYKITWLENVPAGTLLYSAAQGAKP
jgi:hypothetical protein